MELGFDSGLHPHLRGGPGAVAGQNRPMLCMYPHPPTPDLNKACGNAMDAHEAAQMHQNFSQQLLRDHIEACSLPEHNLITVGAQGGETK